MIGNGFEEWLKLTGRTYGTDIGIAYSAGVYYGWRNPNYEVPPLFAPRSPGDRAVVADQSAVRETRLRHALQDIAMAGNQGMTVDECAAMALTALKGEHAASQGKPAVAQPVAMTECQHCDGTGKITVYGKEESWVESCNHCIASQAKPQLVGYIYAGKFGELEFSEKSRDDRTCEPVYRMGKEPT